MNGYLLQALAIPLWWAGMLLSARVYQCFAFPGISRTALFAFLVPDILVIAGLSLRIWRKPNCLLQACVLGAFAYGTLWCIAVSLATRGGYLSSIVMVLGTLFNGFLLLDQDAFRPSNVADARRNLRLTLLQSAVIWALALVVFPLGIMHAVGQWPPAVTTLSLWGGGILFVGFSMLNIWSGHTMATEGKGTPLPMESARTLVTSGPYAYVRNPMAVAGLGQGLGVAVMLRSTEVALYVLAGMLVWNYFVRPVEERYLARVFGQGYLRYRQQVRCWLPRGRPYRA